MSKTVFLRDGTKYHPTSEINLDMHNTLPPKNFIIQEAPMGGGLYLEEVGGFELPSHLYGNTERQSDRILSTFNERPATTGVLLSGEKGSGKTLLAKVISAKAAIEGCPTIIINQPWIGDKFNKLLQDINQPCVIFFDEFEKTYDSDKQEKLLTVLDGVFTSKKLFMLTCNDSFRIDRHMLNRPGRLYYALDFVGLSGEFVREYCRDNLKSQQFIDQVGQVVTLFDQFNFDMLKALVEEMNRYDESPRDALEMLNVKPRGDSNGRWDVSLTVGGVKIIDADMNNTWSGNPLQEGELEIYYNTAAATPAANDEEDSMDDLAAAVSGSRRAVFSQNDLQRIEPGVGRLIYANGDGEVVTFTRKREAIYDYRNSLVA
jgi:hypothetical protein